MPRKANRRRGGGGRGGDGARGDGEDVAGDGDDVGGQGGGRGAVNRGRGGSRGGGRGPGGMGRGEVIRGRGRAGGGRGEADRGRGRAGGGRGEMNVGLAGGRGRGVADGDEGNQRKSKADYNKYYREHKNKDWYEPVEQDQQQGGGGEGGGGEEVAAAHQQAIEEVAAAHQGGGEQVAAAHQEVEEAAGPDLHQLLKDCLKAEEFITDLKRWKRPPKQINVATNPWSKNVATDLKEFTLDWENAPSALQQFFVESRKYFEETYPFLIIPGMTPNGSLTKIPMALEMETNADDRRHHIVNLKMTTKKAIAQILATEYSGYCCAFRVLYEGDDPKLIPWCVHNDHILPDRFKPWHNIRYDSSYSTLADVKVEEGIGYKIFNFLESFRNKALDVKSKEFLKDKSHRQRTTPRGKLLFDTLYVLIAEGRRFLDIARWIIRFLGRIPGRFVDLILHWLKSSRCIFYLYLYLLQDDLSKYLLEDDFSKYLVENGIEETEAKVIEKWEKANEKLSHLQLYKKGDTLDRTLLYKLSGQQLVLLRNAPDLFDAILMRRAGYPGPRMDQLRKMLARV